MWIMIVMTTYFNGYKAASSPSVTSIEFTTRERCIAAAKYTKKQPAVFNAFCVQK